MNSSLYTIGHSNHHIEKFIELLDHWKIQVVVDVRSAPFSSYAPRFNRRQIEECLKLSGFRYLFLGDLIGGKPKDPAFLDGRGRADYAKLATAPSFQSGIDRLEKGLAAGWRIVLMCAEEEPMRCHRHWLIARELELGRHVRVFHLRADGTELRAIDHFGSGPAQLEMF
jgi:uncharacterized protein (DUF488 family)